MGWLERMSEEASKQQSGTLEDAIKRLMLSIGIPVEDLEKRLKSLPEHSERRELLEQVLREAGYSIEIDQGGGEAGTLSRQVVRLHKLQSTVEVVTFMKDWSGGEYTIDTTVSVEDKSGRAEVGKLLREAQHFVELTTQLTTALRASGTDEMSRVSINSMLFQALDRVKGAIKANS